jgi:hypothetical protein
MMIKLLIGGRFRTSGLKLAAEMGPVDFDSKLRREISFAIGTAVADERDGSTQPGCKAR